MTLDETKPDANGTAAAGAASAERALLLPQSRETFEFAPDAQLVTDSSGVILEATQAASMLFRCAKEFLIGKPLALFSAEGARVRFYEALSRLRQGVASDVFESRIARRDESPREVHVIACTAGAGNNAQPT